MAVLFDGGVGCAKACGVHFVSGERKDNFESVVMEHLTMNGAYWGLNTLDLLRKIDTVDANAVVTWIMACQHESGGFGGNIGHDPHVLYTLSAVQCLALFDKIHLLDIEKVTKYINKLQNEDGSFSGDLWGEVDTRFSYISICCLALLCRLDSINVEKAVDYIVSCKNMDGGFGCVPGGESHAGQIFCCVGALAITGHLDRVDKDLLGWWLCERQVKSGGLNGRPAKLPDVFYSWWVLSSLTMIGRVNWIDKEKLIEFILNCQDTEKGGISDMPDDAVDIYHTFFGVVKLEGDIAQGVAYYKKALYYNWYYADAMYNLGVAYGEMLKFDMAIVFYELAFHFNPHCAEACNNLGVIYKDRDNLDKAVECYELALSIKPNFSQSLNNLGVVYTVQGKMDAAANMIQKAIIANPTYSEAYNNLGVLYRDAGNISAAIAAYEHCLKIDPDSRNACQNRLLAMNYINEGDDDKLFEAHRDWGRRFTRLFPQYTSWDNPKYSERLLVIGYVSPDYFTHSVSYFIEAPLPYHDYENFRVVVYSAVVKADPKTIRFRDRVLKNGGIWRDIYGLDEKKIASVIREDKVDILVELTGHTANNKLGMMACRPAPVQVTWIGYPNTTGLSTIDYRITDSLVDPPDSKQKYLSVPFSGMWKNWFGCQNLSSVIRLHLSWACLSNSCSFKWFCYIWKLQQLGEGDDSAALDFVITSKVMQVWASILCAVSNSRLVVKCKPFCCDSVRQTILSTTLEQLGMEPQRVDLLPLILLNHDHMQAYSLMDISLDTFPYAGTTTTCESLYMGVPRIAMAGSVHAHNVGASLLTKVGLGHLIAKDEDEYVELAIKLASDVTALSTLRMGLRERMSKSPLCDGQKFTTGLESAYRDMWRRYCNEDVPALKNLEMLKQEAGSATPDLSSAPNMSVTAEAPHVSVKENGFSQASHAPTLSSFKADGHQNQTR